MDNPAPGSEPLVSPEAPGTDEATEPDGDHPSREAASYRRRLRETEGERDTLRERVNGYERREAEGIARSLGAAVPGDLWTLVSLDDFRNEDGVLDEELVRERVGTILNERPTWRLPAPDLGAGPRPGTEERREPGLSALFGKRR
jgi:hypothetical protein